MAHKTYLDELQNNYKTEKDTVVLGVQYRAMGAAGTKLPPKIFPPVRDV